MSELNAILKAFKQTDFEARQAALATVISVTGSSYRSPGARMYITDDGRWTGSISGGCLEGDALRKARQVMREGKPMLLTYDTHEESGQSLGVALGCNGIIEVLLQPVSRQNSPFGLLQEIAQAEQPTALATVCGEWDAALGAQWLQGHASALPEAIAASLSEVLHTGQSVVKAVMGMRVFFEIFEPPIRLAIYGAGFDARPVALFAQQLGWQVSVSDECAAHLIPNFFPSAALISCQREQLSASNMHITPYTAAVLMSHNLHYDTAALKALLQSPARYIGILGPRKRTDKILLALEAEGIVLTESDWRRLHSPVGLDIGAGSPEEIALSILAEIKAVFAGRKGGFLKERKGAIHDKVAEQVLKEVYVKPYH